MNTSAIWTADRQSIEVTVLDYSAEGFLIRSICADDHFPKQGQLLIWGQKVAVETRHHRVDENGITVGLQRLDVSTAAASVVEDRVKLRRQRYYASGQSSGLWYGSAAIILATLGSGWMGMQFSVREPNSKRLNAPAVVQSRKGSGEARHASAYASPALSNLDLSQSQLGPKVRDDATTVVVSPIAPEGHIRELDLGLQSGEQVRHRLDAELRNRANTSFRLRLTVGQGSHRSILVELLCSREAVQHLLRNLTARAGDWTSFRGSVASLVSPPPHNSGVGKSEIVWHDLRLHLVSDRAIRLELA